LTSGRRKLNVGLSFQHTSFDSVDGLPLDDIRTNGIPFANDRTVLSLQVATDRVVASATYGVTERVDVGIHMPFGRTRVSGTHTCSCPSSGTSLSVVEDASSSGIGDVELQTKMHFPSFRVLDVAASFDVRLPTGDQEKLLGTGAAQGRVMFIGAARHDVIAPHFNVGYTFGGRGFTPMTGAGARTLARALEAAQPSPEFDYTVGVDAVVTPYVTLAGDVLGRSLRDSVRIYTMTFPGISEPNEAAAAVNLLLGAVGAKINVGSTWLTTFTVLFPLNSNGLKPRVAPVVGFEAAF
jgi:hypothetical protein